MVKNVVVMTLALLVLCQSGSAQQLAWQKHYGIPNRDVGFGDASLLSDGGFILAGTDHHLENPTQNIFVVRANSGGDTIWTRRYDFCESEAARAVLPILLGGYVITGWHVCPPDYVPYLALMKTNDDGDTLWIMQPPGNQNRSEGYSTVETPEGDFITSGVISDGFMWTDIFICRTSSVGNLVWTRRIVRPDLNEGSSRLIQTRSGDFLLVGDYQEAEGINSDCFALKLKANGDTLWLRTYGEINTTEYANSVVEAPGTGFVLAGLCADGAQLTKIDNSGAMLWQKTFGGNGAEMRAIATSGGGSFLVGGTFLMKVNSEGDSLWSTILPGTARSVGMTEDGGVFAAGYDPDSSSGFLVKYWPPLLCGDAEGNGIVSISDAVYLIGYIIAGGPVPSPPLSGDTDCSGLVNISDAVYLINYIFAGGPAPCAACK